MAPERQADFSVERAIRIQATLAPKLNLAFYQNSLPVLRELVSVGSGLTFYTGAIEMDFKCKT